MRRFVFALVILLTLLFSACGESLGPNSEGAGDGDGTCAPGFDQCNGTCVSLGENVNHCGGCGVACTTGAQCTAGVCACFDGLNACALGCSNPLSDGNNCGGCGIVCEGALVCSQGGCTDSCAASETQCGNSCVDTQTDTANCGMCGISCAAGQSCTAGACSCPGGQTSCNGTCTDTLSDPAHCGTCGNSCGAGACVSGVCEPTAGTGGSGSGGSGSGGDGSGTGGSGTGGSPPTGSCEEGSTSTEWATSCRTTPYSCTAGTWTNPGPEPSNSSLVFQAESAHFVIYRMSHISLATNTVNDALAFMENEIWGTYFGNPMYMKEPYCNSANKYKNVIHIRDDVGLQGGSWNSGGPKMGMWVGPGALNDPWGLAHEFMHGVQSISGGMSCGGGNNYCGWWYESHANWSAHQVNPSNAHCSELFVNATHLHLGNLRNRYCNWQFAEFLKDKYCYEAVNEIWTEGSANDPFSKIMTHMGWDVAAMNDFFGEWAMHNITWDYQNPPPTAGGNKQSTFKSSYGDIDSTGNQGQRLQRKTRLESLDSAWQTNRRFVTNYYWAPQRWGYNVVELFPEEGADEITVTFKGVAQSGANSGWRYGLVATNSGLSTARYGDVHVGSGTESSATFCVNPGERIWLVVLAAPTVQIQINWNDHNYPNLYRYPWMVQLAGAWPEGFQGGTRTCAQGSPHSNGGGCVAGGTVASSAYVGPYARVLGGTVSGNARIEDHAIIRSGTVSDSAVVGGLTVLNNFNVTGSAVVRSTFLPVGWFGANSASGTAQLVGDLECYSNKSSGSYTGFVDNGTGSMSIAEVTTPPPYSW